MVDSPLISLAARWAASPNDAAVLEEVGTGLESLGALVIAAEAFAPA